MNKTILEAPNYQIDENGTVTNISKGNVVLPSKDGKVGLYVLKTGTFGGRPIQEKLREFFSVKKLVEQYFGEKDEVEKKEKKTKNEVSFNEAKKQHSEKKVKEKKSAKKSGADLIREAYDKNPEAFDMKKFSEESGIPYGRVWGCIKKYKAKKNEN